MLARIGAWIKSTLQLKSKECFHRICRTRGSPQCTLLSSNHLTRHGTGGSEAGILDDFAGGPQSVLKLSQFYKEGNGALGTLSEGLRIERAQP